MKDANEKGDETELVKAKEAIRIHKSQNETLKRKANQAGYFWA